MNEQRLQAPWLKSFVKVELSRYRLDEAGRPLPLSTGGLSSIYIGKLHLSSGAKRRVAIKRFRQPLADEEALTLQLCIDALHRARVSLPKCAVVPLRGNESGNPEWVQVSQLFGSWKRGSKLSQQSLYYRSLDTSARAEAVAELCRVANAGYRPALDIFLALDADAPSIMPLDLDLIVLEPSAERRAFHLLRCTMQISAEPTERRTLLGIARAEALEPISAELERRLNDPDDPFRPYWDSTR